MKKVISIVKKLKTLLVSFFRKTNAALCIVAACYVVHLYKTLDILVFTGTTYKVPVQENVLPGFLDLMILESKIILFFLLLYLIFRTLEKVFRGKWSGLLILLCVVYLHLISILRHPQLYDDFESTSNLVLEINKLLNPELILVFGFFIIIFCFTQSHKTKKFNHWTKAILGTLLIFANIYIYNDFLAADIRKEYIDSYSESKIINKKTDRRSIVILSVDSLREDQALDISEHNKAIKYFTQNSLHFKNVFTTQPQTHVSLSSLLSEKTPQEHNLRNFLDKKSTSNNDFYIGNTIKSLKKRGYKIYFLMDNQAFAHFKKNDYVDEYLSPQQGTRSFIWPSMLRSGLFWAFLNNKIGDLIIGNIEMNSEYAATYRIEKFTDYIRKTIKDLELKKDPYLLIVHTCGLHWPGVAPYPYYKKIQHNQFPYFSYETRYLKSGQLPFYTSKTWWERSKINYEIYKNNLNWVNDKFLEPVLSALFTLTNKPLIALTSDHGEDFWTSGKYPYDREPSHTRAQIFSASAEKIRFDLFTDKKIHYTNLYTQTENSFSITQILSILEKLSSDQSISIEKKNVYTESSLWVNEVMPGEFNLYKNNMYKDSFRVNGKDNTIYTEFPEEATVLQKIRSVQDGNYRLTVYPTDYGFQAFLCDKIKDKECTTNIVKSQLKIFLNQLSSLNQANHIDISKGLYPKLEYDKNRPGFLKFKIHNEAINNKNLLFLKASELIFKYNNAFAAYSIFDLIDQNLVDEKIKFNVQNLKFQLCNRGDLSKKDYDVFKKITSLDDFKYVYDFDQDNNDDLKEPLNIFRCLKNIMPQTTYKKFFHEYFLFNKKNIDIKFFSANLATNEDNRKNLFKEIIEEFSIGSKERRNALYTTLTSSEYTNDQVKEFFDTLKGTAFSIDMEREFVLDENGKSNWRNALSKEFKTDHEYNLMIKLEQYFYLKYGRRDLNYDEILQLVEEILSIQQAPYMSFIIVDNFLFKNEIKAFPVLNVSRIQGLPKIDKHLFMKDYLKFLKQMFFCKSNKNINCKNQRKVGSQAPDYWNEMNQVYLQKLPAEHYIRLTNKYNLHLKNFEMDSSLEN